MLIFGTCHWNRINHEFFAVTYRCCVFGEFRGVALKCSKWLTMCRFAIFKALVRLILRLIKLINVWTNYSWALICDVLSAVLQILWHVVMEVKWLTSFSGSIRRSLPVKSERCIRILLLRLFQKLWSLEWKLLIHSKIHRKEFENYNNCWVSNK